MALAGLRHKAFIVTGGASGIGRATATRLAAERALVAIIDRDEARVDQTIQELGSEHALGVVADVSDAEQIREAFKTIRARYGQVYGLHNNAAITLPSLPLSEVQLEQFDALMAVNLRGFFVVLGEMLRTLHDQNTPGTIVNTSSGLGARSAPTLGVYAASKAAVLSITRTAAVEEGPNGTRINAILPGPIETAMLAALNAEEFAGAVARVPLGRAGGPDEVAALVTWLLSDESSYVNGGRYFVDGGDGA